MTNPRGYLLAVHHSDAAVNMRAMAQLRAHADNSPLACVTLDSRGCIRDWSQGAERMFGRPKSEMVDTKGTECGWLDEDAEKLLAGWLQTPSDSAPRFSGEMQLDHADIGAISCEVYGSVLSDGAGQQSLSLQILDITERRQAEEVRSLLIGELNHRIKNTLANVQAIARQSLRQSESRSHRCPTNSKVFKNRRVIAIGRHGDALRVIAYSVLIARAVLLDHVIHCRLL